MRFPISHATGAQIVQALPRRSGNTATPKHETGKVQKNPPLAYLNGKDSELFSLKALKEQLPVTSEHTEGSDLGLYIPKDLRLLKRKS